MKRQFIFWVLVSLLVSVKDAQAYLDPGTGSLLLQGLVAGVATGLVVIRLYWKRMKAFLFTRSQKAKATADGVPKGDGAR